MSNIISQIPIFELQFSRIESQIEDFTSSKNRKVMDLDKHKSFLDENSDLILPTDKTNEQLREEQRKIDELINEEEGNNGKLKERLGNYLEIMDKGECPTCGSIVNKDFEFKVQHLSQEKELLVNKINQYYKDKKECMEKTENLNAYHSKRKEIEHHVSLYKIVGDEIEGYFRNIMQLEQQKQDINNNLLSTRKESGEYSILQKFIDKLEQEKQEVERQQQIYNELDILDNSKTNIENDLHRFKTQKEKLHEIIENLNSETTQKETELSPLISLKSSLLDPKDKLSSLDSQSSRLSKEIIENKTSLEYNTENKEKLKRDVLENKGKLDKKKFLDEYFHWFNQYYLPSIVNIENHVLELLRKRFNEHFQNWFDTLVDDPSLRVDVDESFSPKITRNTFVQDYAQLSGGERTSIALAYRLALNTIVREVSFEKPIELLILDEPTEGFSKEQLFKLRGVLDKVNCTQIIIVSHEQELDGLVDQIYFVENNYGISCVKTVAPSP